MSVGTPAPDQPPPGVSPPPPATAAGRGSTRRRRLPATFLVVALVAIVLWTATSSAVDDAETVQPTAAVTGLEVELDAGAIRLVSVAELRVDVARQAGRFAGTPTVTTETMDGVLRITGDCPTLAIGRCDTSVTVTLPTITTIDVATGAGPIRGTLTQGTVREHRSRPHHPRDDRGHRRARRHHRCRHHRRRGPDATYDVSAHTAVGRVDIDVETAAEAARTIRARADVGAIRIRTPE